MSSLDLTRDWLRNVLRPYPSHERILSEVMGVLAAHRTLQVKTDAFTFDSGQTALLLLLHGTLPINYRGATYQIPINVWVPHEYPRLPPVAFVVPTKEMGVRKSREVDPGGRVREEVVGHWWASWPVDRISKLDEASDTQTRDLATLLNKLIEIFSLTPPVYAKPPEPARSSTSSTASSQPPHPPQHSFSQPQPTQPPPPSRPSPFAHAHTNGEGLPGYRDPYRQVSYTHGRQASLSRHDSVLSSTGSDGSPAPPGSPPVPLRPGQVPPVPARPGFLGPARTQSPLSLGGPQSPVSSAGGAPWQPQPQVYGQPAQVQPPVPPHQQYSGQWQQGQVGSPPPQPPQAYPTQQAQPYPPQQPAQVYPPQAPQQPAQAYPPLAPQHPQAFPPQQQPQQAQYATQPPAQPPHPQHPQHPQPTITARAPDFLTTSPETSTTSLPDEAPPVPPSKPPPPSVLHLHAVLLPHLTSALPPLMHSLQAQKAHLVERREDLATGEPAIRDEMARLEAVKKVCDAVGGKIDAVVAAGEGRVNELEGRGDVSVDEVVCGISIVHNQLIDLVAEDNALSDTMYHLTRALDAERIDLDRYLKAVRSLAREQYMKRALIERINEGMGQASWSS